MTDHESSIGSKHPNVLGTMIQISLQSDLKNIFKLNNIAIKIHLSAILHIILTCKRLMVRIDEYKLFCVALRG